MRTSCVVAATKVELHKFVFVFVLCSSASLLTILSFAQQQGKELVDSIDQFIQISNDNDLLKKEKIYTEWESQVFNNIQKAMEKSLEKIVSAMFLLCLYG